MKAITFERFGGPEVLRLSDRPRPLPAASEVLIKVAAAGVNRADLSQRDGSYPVPQGADTLLGLEAAGEIVQVGDGVDAAWLDRMVCALTAGGAYAEYVATPAVQCLPVPEPLSLLEAAALPEAAMTVWSNVFGMGTLRAGGALLVHGGTSGIGTFAIQYALARGCRVMATAGGAEKCKAVAALGATAVDYRVQDFEQEALAWTGGRGVDVVLDMGKIVLTFLCGGSGCRVSPGWRRCGAGRTAPASLSSRARKHR